VPVTITGGVAPNGAVRLHYLDAHADGSSGLPIVIVPGLAETAEDYTGLMRRLAPRRCVAISLRGRGRSDTPASGYTLDDHADDVLAVVRHLGLPRPVLVAFSRGVPYAIRCAARRPGCVAGLALGDYAAVHTRLPQEWAPRFLAGRWRGTPSPSGSPRRSCTPSNGNRCRYRYGMSCGPSAARCWRSAAAGMGS
jgi:pimeloyl-ACP methyl ester carboxylesterase